MNESKPHRYDEWYVREMILHGDHPAKRFKQAEPEAQNRGLKRVRKEALIYRSYAQAIFLGGVTICLALFFFSEEHKNVLMLSCGATVCFVAAALALLFYRSRTTALRRLDETGILSPEQRELIHARR